MNRVLLAGATGYLGSYILQELQKKQYDITVLVRNPQKLKETNSIKIKCGEITKREDLYGICEHIDVVISTVGITRQKDGLTYMDVDYGGNVNLLEEAKRSGVKKFIYISALNGEQLRHLKICDAKERFVDELKNAGLEYCIIRPNGFFSDITEFYHMAKKGRVFLFGKGDIKFNPIHGDDLAKVCVNSIETNEKEVRIGGPEILTQNELAKMAFEAVGKKPKVTYIPNWIRWLTLKFMRTFFRSKTYGPIEFFLTVMTMDMIAPKYGTNTIKNYFKEL